LGALARKWLPVRSIRRGHRVVYKNQLAKCIRFVRVKASSFKRANTEAVGMPPASLYDRTWGRLLFSSIALAEVVTAKHKGPEVDSLGAFMRARKRVTLLRGRPKLLWPL
jgi:hypothetical protein